MNFNKRWIVGAMILLFSFVSAKMQAQERKIEDMLDLSLEELLNLEVTTASKSAEKLYDAAGVISVITQDELSRYRGTSLRDILERVPSLTMTSAFFTDRVMVAARGDQSRINSGHILYLINGRPVREIVEGGVSSEMLTSFPVEAIDRIEVIRGPGSVLYGSNAFSAVVNIITKKAKGNSLTASGIAGNGGAYGVNANATVSKGDFNLIGGARLFNKREWDVAYTGFNFLDPLNPSVTDITIPDESTGLFVGMSYKNLTFNASHNEYRTSYFTQGFPDINKWGKTFMNLGYELNVSDNWSMDFNLTHTSADLASGQFPGITRDSRDVVAEWTNQIKLNDKSRVVVGGLYNYIKGEEFLVSIEPALEIASEERGTVAMYSQIDYWVVDNLKLIGGFQANKVSGLDLNVVPRLGAIWYPIEKLNVKALYGQAFRAPSVDEIGLNFPGFTGNPNINPERVASIDFGVNYLGEKVQLGVNYFSNMQRDIISPSPQINGESTYINNGEITFSGVEFEGKYFPSTALQLFGSVLYQDNEDQDGNENVTPIANFSAKGGLSYKWTNGITASIFANYQGELDEKYSSSLLNPQAVSYTIVNLYADFDLVKILKMDTQHQLGLFIQGDNMLDKEVWLPDWGGVQGETIPVLPGRAIYLGVKLGLR